MRTAKELKVIFKGIERKTELQFIKFGNTESVMPKNCFKFNEGMEEKKYYEGYARGRLETIEEQNDLQLQMSKHYGGLFLIEEIIVNNKKEISELKELLGEKKE